MVSAASNTQPAGGLFKVVILQYWKSQILEKVTFWGSLNLWEGEICLQTLQGIDLAKVVPLVWHADEADSHRRRSFCVATFSSAVVTGDPWDCKFMVYCMDTAMAINETFETLDVWAAYSFLELQEGRFCSVDPYDRPFNRGKAGSVAGPFRAVLVAFKGDEKYTQRALKMITSWISKDGICSFCKASPTGDLIYTKHGLGAPHRATLCSNDDFLRLSCRNGPWLRLPGFHKQIVMLDWMHLVDLAVLPECAASVPCQSSSTNFTIISSVLLGLRGCLLLCATYGVQGPH